MHRDETRMSHDPSSPSPERGRPVYREVFRAAPDGILIVDPEGRIQEANPAAEELFGYPTGVLEGREVELLVPGDLRRAHRGHRERYGADPQTRPMGIGMELRGRRRDGTTFPVEISLSPFERGGEACVIAAVRDVTERRRLRSFGAGTLRAAEEERRRLARELHDDTLQRLATALLRLRVILGTECEERREELIEDLREEVLTTAEGVRRIARGLRPPALDDLGVIPALRAHLRGFQGIEGLDVTFDMEEGVGEVAEELLEYDEKLVLYRVVQEAVSNAVRHASADRISVRLRLHEQGVRTLIEDDGAGFDARFTEADEVGGLGLTGMQERAELAGGTLDVETEPQRGTRIRLTIPVAMEGAARG